MVEVGCDLRIIENITEIARSRQDKQLNFLIAKVAVDSITCGDRHTCLDSWALRRSIFIENDQLIVHRIGWIMMMMVMMMFRY